MAKETGGAAYPSKQVLGQGLLGSDITKEHAGMTLLDYFAGQALAGISGHVAGPNARGDETAAQAHARWSYNVAKAMLAERSKP